MKLNEYIKQFPKSARTSEKKRLAECLGVSYPYVKGMCNGSRRIPEKYAVVLEIATNGQVKREDISPELYKPFSILKQEYKNRKEFFPGT